MITMSGEELLMWLLFGLPLASMIILSILGMGKKVVGYFVGLYAHRKAYKSKQDELKEFKAKGGIHEWVKIAISTNEEVHACKHTGYVPSKEGFVSVEYIRQIILAREEQAKYEEFKSIQLYKIGTKYGLKPEEISELYNEVMSIKSAYAIQKMDNLIKEMREKGNTEIQ